MSTAADVCKGDVIEVGGRNWLVARKPYTDAGYVQIALFDGTILDVLFVPSDDPITIVSSWPTTSG